jgi:S1 RNA binding domain
MPHHVVVDGSNLATEGRALPSLQQLNDAVLAFIAENPDALITVVVDATFGHRIDPREVPEFDAAVANNEVVAPPAGAVGRGDAFVLSIANKVRATVLSNDSFQEFHGQYPWLFDEGRLIGGKPVPHIGWVFVPRVPVRGPISRSAVKQAKRKGDGSAADAPVKRRTSPEASQPMPVPKAPPPNATIGKQGGRGGQRQSAAKEAHSVDHVPAAATPAPKASAVNDLLPFLDFVQHHPVGTSVNAVVESYSSHGAYVRIGEAHGYVPLRLMADPAPRSAREFMKIGDAVTLVVSSFAAARRSIELAAVGMAPAAAEVPAAKAPRKRGAKPIEAVPSTTEELAPATPAPAKKGRGKKAAAEPVVVGEVAPVEPPPVKKAAKKAPSKQAPSGKVPAKKAPAKTSAGTTTPTEAAAAPAPEQPAPVKKAATTKKTAPAKAAGKKASPAPIDQSAPAAKPAAKRTRKASAAPPEPAAEPARTTPGGRSRRTR